MSAATLTDIAWVAVDWGTTHLRALAMDAQGRDLAALASRQGMGALDRDDYEPVLRALLAPWLGERVLHVIACGMVGSRQGWIEAPYQPVPCPARPVRLVQAPVRLPGLRVDIVPGLRQDEPADVMRGEETQIAGFLAGNPDFDGLICLPGSHSKWARVRDNQVLSFQTSMTGELFAALSRHTVLRHSIAETGFALAAFRPGLRAMLRQPETLSLNLFSLRAQHLLGRIDPAAARARLSGLLIGAELASMRSLLQAHPVAIIGAAHLSELYRIGLAELAVTASCHDAAEMTRAGLHAIHQTLETHG